MVKYFWLVFLSVSCTSNKTEPICQDINKIIYGHFHSIPFKFEETFKNITENDLNHLKIKHPCVSEVNIKSYANLDGYRIFVGSTSDNTGTVLISNGSHIKSIPINSFKSYKFIGVSKINNVVKLFLLNGNDKEIIIFKNFDKFIFWHTYDF